MIESQYLTEYQYFTENTKNLCLRYVYDHICL